MIPPYLNLLRCHFYHFHRTRYSTSSMHKSWRKSKCIFPSERRNSGVTWHKQNRINVHFSSVLQSSLKWDNWYCVFAYHMKQAIIYLNDHLVHLMRTIFHKWNGISVWSVDHVQWWISSTKNHVYPCLFHHSISSNTEDFQVT